MEHQEPDLADIKRRMEGAITALHHEFSGLRTGRASASLVDPLTVDAYGTQMPITQVGTVTVPEPRMISIQVWDKGMVSAVEKAIRESGLGLNPVVDGQLLRLPIPELTEERRIELTKLAGKYAEQAKVAIRNVRRDGMDQIKRMQKEHHMTEDEHKMWHDEIQELTDGFIEQVDEVTSKKEADIMQV